MSQMGIVRLQKDIEIAGKLQFSNVDAVFDLSNHDVTLLSGELGTAAVGKLRAVASLSYSGTGRFVVERYIPAHSKAWQLLSIPTIGSTIHESWQEGSAPGMSAAHNAPFQPGNPHPGFGITITSNRPTWQQDGFDLYTAPGPSLKTYDPNTGSWTGIASTAKPLDDHDAYMVFVRGDRSVVTHNAPATAVTLRSRGFLKAPGLFAPEALNIPPQQFALVGNPYASAIDYRLIESTNLNDSYTIWDPQLTTSGHSAYGLGGYRTISSSAGIAVPGGGHYPDGNIPPLQSGQAFFVQSSDQAATLQFTEDCKLDGSTLVFRKGKFHRPAAAIRANLHVVKQNMVLVDGTLIQFHPLFSDLHDNLDAVKMANPTENIAISSRQNSKLILERRPLPQVSDTIQYLLSNLTSSQYALEIVFEDSSQAFQHVILYDN